MNFRFKELSIATFHYALEPCVSHCRSISRTVIWRNDLLPPPPKHQREKRLHGGVFPHKNQRRNPRLHAQSYKSTQFLSKSVSENANSSQWREKHKTTFCSEKFFLIAKNVSPEPLQKANDPSGWILRRKIKDHYCVIGKRGRVGGSG